MKDSLPPDSLGSKAGMGAEALTRAADAPLRELGLAYGVYASLADVGLESVADVARATEEELSSLSGLGPISVAQIAEALEHWVARAHSMPDQDQPPSRSAIDNLGRKVGLSPQALARAADAPLRELGLEYRVYAPLAEAGLERVSDVVRTRHDELLRLFGLGAGAAAQVVDALRRWGMRAENTLAAQEEPPAHRLAPSGMSLDSPDDRAQADSDKPLVGRPLDDAAAEQPIEILRLSVRSHNCLGRSGIHRVGELAGMTPKQLLSIWALGVGSLREIVAGLHEFVGEIASPRQRTFALAGGAARAPAAADSEAVLDERPSLLRVALMSEDATGKHTFLDDELRVADLGLAPDTIEALARLCIREDDCVGVIGASALGYLAQELDGAQLDKVIHQWCAVVSGEPVQGFAARVESAGMAAPLVPEMGSASGDDGTEGPPARVLARPVERLDVPESTKRVLLGLGARTMADLGGLSEAHLVRRAGSVGAAAVSIVQLRGAVSRALAEPSDDSDTVQYPATNLAELLRMHVDRCLGEKVSERNKSMCMRRWELDGEAVPGAGPPTLEDLGQAFGLTRERVRQIIRRGRRILRSRRPTLRLKALVAAVRQVLGNSLGICSASYLASELQGRFTWDQHPRESELLLLLGFLPEVHIGGRGEVVHAQACPGLRKAAESHAKALLDELEEPEHFLDFAQHLARRLSARCWGTSTRSARVVPCCGARVGRAEVPGEYVRTILATLEPCPLDGEQVMSLHAAMLRRGQVKRDVVRAALQVLGGPVHYTYLTQFIREHRDGLSKVSDHDVHACLTTYDEFVVTKERGMYGLREWGVERYKTVADQVEELLAARGRPMPTPEIVAALVAQGVPDPNVRACFHQRRFVLDSAGYLGLRVWGEAVGARPSAGEHGTRDVFVIDDEQDELIIG